MRIKKIELIGFKSFADREVVHVDDHVTAVLGPNGCGKSNIVDAMRWCLGEQRAKHLRGSGMRDVIFAGTAKRGPGGMAEVTITFENQGDVPAAYLNFSEIAVTRRLYRDGTSEYLLNKVPSRLRDINELMTGTGAGAKGYSIIEQGQVGRLVTSKPEDRRYVIDEAAGITRFKSQKQAAERKIAQTTQNLLRVSDVIGELEGRLGTLRRQAQKAARYKRYRTELRDLEWWMASHRYLELDMTGRVLEARQADLADQVQNLRTAVQTHETRLSAGRLEFSQCEARLTECQQQVYELENRLQLGEAEAQYRRREQEALRQSVTQSRAEAGIVQQGLTSLEEELEQILAEHETMGEGDDAAEEAAAHLGEEHGAVVRQLRTAQEEFEESRSQHAALQARVASAQAHVESKIQAVTELEERRLALADLVAAAHEELAQAQAEQSGRTEACEAAKRLVEELAIRRQQLDSERLQLRDQTRSAEVELDTLRGELQRARSRLQSLEEIQNRYRGCTSGVQVVMERREQLSEATRQMRVGADGSVTDEPVQDPSQPSAAVLGIMADFVSAPAHLEAAVSAVLGDRLQGVVVDGPQAGVCGVELLKEVQEGRTAFLPRDCRTPVTLEQTIEQLAREPGRMVAGTPVGWAKPGEKVSPFEVVDMSEGAPAGASAEEATATLPKPTGATISTEELLTRPGVHGRLADLIDVPDNMDSLAKVLVGDAIVVDRLVHALELWHSGVTGSTIVTVEGDRIEPSGVVVGGSSQGLDSALLQQKREIRELTEVVEGLTSDFEAARGRNQLLAERLAEVEEQREAIEGEQLVAAQNKVQTEQELQRVLRAIEDATRRVEGVDADRMRLDDEVARKRDEATEMSEDLATDRAMLPDLEDRIVELQGQIAELTDRRDSISERLTEAKVTLARWQQQRDALEQTKARLERQVVSERERAKRLVEKASEGEARIEQLTAEIAAAVDDRAMALDLHKQATERVHDAREAHDTARLSVEELEVALKNLRKSFEEQREILGEVELGLKELRLEASHLAEDVMQRFDQQIEELIIDFHDRPRCGETEKNRQRELKRILGRMGEVNLTAIQEFEEVNARYEYLTGQRTDLEDAIAQLQEAIDTINETTRERFQETFTAVNELFQKLFPRLFNGGKAHLKLTDPTDLLATGVQIIAQPPGKQVRSLELLSGGEKALTATSLIFALFLHRPSPFCLLDEVDAPLDEANVGRFCGMVKEMAQTTQFIIITHNKRTMEIADRLYGVTMQERGVSKLVSVNMRKAVELTQS